MSEEKTVSVTLHCPVCQSHIHTSMELKKGGKTKNKSCWKCNRALITIHIGGDGKHVAAHFRLDGGMAETPIPDSAIDVSPE